MVKKNFWCAVIVGFVALVYMTFGSASAIQAETMKMGCIAPLSGPGAPWGRALCDGVSLAMNDVNKAGGLKIGKKTYQLELIEYDDKYTGEGAAQAANRLISVDKVNIIFGSIGSAPVLAFTPITQKAKVLVLGNSSTNKAIHPGNTYFFRVIQTDWERAEVIIPYVAKKHPEAKTVAFIAPNDESGRFTTSADVHFLTKAGVKVVYNELYERSQTDFAPQLTKILKLNPDILDTSASSPGTTGLIAKQARSMGYKGIFVTSSGFMAKTVVEIAGKAAEGFYFCAAADLASSAPKMKDFIAKYKSLFKKDCDQWSCPLFYDGAHIVFSLMQKQQTTDSTKLRDALEQIKSWEGVTGEMRFSGKETYGIAHQAKGPQYAVTVQDGKEKILELVSPWGD